MYVGKTLFAQINTSCYRVVLALLALLTLETIEKCKPDGDKESLICRKAVALRARHEGLLGQNRCGSVRRQFLSGNGGGVTFFCMFLISLDAILDSPNTAPPFALEIHRPINFISIVISVYEKRFDASLIRATAR